ncbi:MAG: lipid A export permease/ATP-binding protein MsbA [Gallionellales bacterium 35-53-114]|nr:MAG: lipid A export permease/ATP-binding protein MsbA [Gallionellales bacterium 35-53-114]OYZ64021.1 MAG: lipid A export permease/ATP-binding protein MsbA [Gallionellales bacterium 24-53-125]OZB09559.1 MAG: lipid A export permease/ATP-binding protein MsbA [Gallionellales bacterium 39-52-133]HQS59256.1 lipid A export permease/ATP-binding protein MsbA [Gallionellaceae bacterium]HQS75992.1 lipid A export permease/ATP-binding protein MsbA [Gallionellaceae bacterium]
MTNSQLYLRLLSYVKPYWRIFLLSIVATAITAATEPLLPALLKPMLDGTFVNRDETIIRLVPVFILLIFLVRGIASFVSAYTIGWVGDKVVMDLRNEMFRKLMTLHTRYYDDHATGQLISKFTFDVTRVTEAATNVVTVTIRDSIIIIGLMGWLLYLNWKLTMITLIMLPVIAMVIRVINVRMRSSSRDSQRAMGNVTQVIEESITAHKVVKLFGGQQYESERFGDRANWVRRYSMKQTAANAANVPIVQMVAAFALAFLFYLAIEQSRTDGKTVGEFLSYIVAMMMLTSPLKRIAGVSVYLQNGLAAAESVFELLDTPNESDTGKVEIERAKGKIAFEHVNFSYQPDQADARLALRDICLDIPAGQSVALVGASGSGKTTIANLVPRFYSPTSGRITLDGHDLADLTLASLRANIALVSQEVVLFNDTVAANIAYGQMREVPEAEIIAAATAAHAMEFIKDMPQGLNTLVGEKGVRMSGGQRQRIAIARAILKNAPILILDEATSALDSESERHVQAALETLMQGRTTLVIAHRLSTIEKADRIVVMQKGQIVEIGTHRELLDKGGVYAQLHHIQFELNETVSENPPATPV